ncbi:hypothetical protein LALCM10_130170 [Dellaglioa algida]|nr:hypothetical protein LALCM10_130170 [Dellaglioa algida]
MNHLILAHKRIQKYGKLVIIQVGKESERITEIFIMKSKNR